ncbi:hypothetical protein GN244_ATG09321 [Phytophthora infestans]|uniref:Uncharacterized protein n=1 Tax=Phytophthora infestans TaxID=4787 RepID=A0A833WV14_PHYIN|nr:hypothetical protein GN244_ATG09321 [Phytophthora infestans]KAF4134931.1 hypothetical protein GN958_ATG15865 [Phytophthora infestans]
MNVLLSSLTYIFALPSKTFEGELHVALLAEQLICDHNLLDPLCSIIDHYHHSSKVSRSAEHEVVVLVLLEAIRVVRQWSEYSSLVPRFENSCIVRDRLLPLMIEQLQIHSNQSSPKKIVLVLEILLVFRSLAASHGLRSVLASFENLQMSLKWLCSSGTFRTSCDAHGDGNLIALMAREARNVQKLLGMCLDVSPPIVRNGSAVVVSKVAMVTTQKQVRSGLVRPETLRAYGYKR